MLKNKWKRKQIEPLQMFSEQNFWGFTVTVINAMVVGK